MPDENGWNEYKRLVLGRLDRNENAVADLGRKLDQLRTRFASLEFRLAVGAAAALGLMGLLANFEKITRLFQHFGAK